MDAEQKFYLRVIIFSIVGLILIVAMICGSCGYQYYKTADAIKCGVNPVAAKYAFSYSTPAEDALAWMSVKNQSTVKGE